MFYSLAGCGLTLTLFAIFIISNKPPSAPSLAQHKVELQKQGSVKNEKLVVELKKSAEEFIKLVRILFRDPNFVAVWFLFGASNPVLRNNNILLSSAFRKEFHSAKDIGFKMGLVLMLAWAMYTAGGLICGPVIRFTKKYKETVVFGEFGLFTSCLCIFFGMYFKVVPVIYTGVVIQGNLVFVFKKLQLTLKSLSRLFKFKYFR